MYTSLLIETMTTMKMAVFLNPSIHYKLASWKYHDDNDDHGEDDVADDEDDDEN